MKTKYPPTTRVTAGKLHVGDTILVRERQSDAILVRGNDIGDPNREVVPPGTYEIRDIESYLDQGGRRANRHYVLTLQAVDRVESYVIDVMFITRLNWIV